MSWEEVLKEKFQGPQSEHGRFIGIHSRLKSMELKLTFIEEEIAKPTEVSEVMIKSHVKDLRKILDDLDKDLIEVAKYGGSTENLSADRQDSKFISNYGAKYREDSE